MTVIERTGYTVLDILSDVGGLQGILISAISLLLTILNHNYLDNYLAAKLFKVSSNSEVSLKALPMARRIQEFCFEKILPSKLVCCRRDRKHRAMDQARTSLSKEADILKIFRTQRFVLLALEHLLDPVLHKDLKTRSKYKEVVIEKTNPEL